MKIIAYIETDFPTKFGIPRQSGLIEELCGRIVMEPEYRNPQCVKGLEEFSHIWLLWEFSEAKRDKWSAIMCRQDLAVKCERECLQQERLTGPIISDPL